MDTGFKGTETMMDPLKADILTAQLDNANM
jgi:hypothetical protein